MRVRLSGTTAEVAEAASRLRSVFEVVEESADYPNRPPSIVVRRYLEVRL